MQKSEPIRRKMPIPIEFEFAENASLTDGVVTLTHKDVSRIKIIGVDADNYLIYEVTPPKKSATKSLNTYFGEDRLIKAVTTITSLTGETKGKYTYYKRGNGSYYAIVTGEQTGDHRIELGKLTQKDSPIFSLAKAIVYSIGDKKFSRKDLKPLIPSSLQYGQKLKALLDTLHFEGFLTKEMEKTAKKKEKEIYSATEKMKEIIIAPSAPEQT